MSELILVRHGQASFGADSYDKLSEKGVEQVKLLCRHWQSLGAQFDHIYSGELIRQKETAAELRPLLRDPAVVPREIPALNEYNGDPLLKIYLRKHAQSEGFDPLPEWPVKDARLFQSLFEAATARWIGNGLAPDDEDTEFEHFADFRARVYGALDDIMASHSGGSRVLISTSGGVIAMALQRVLGFSDEQVINTNWMVHNSSVTRIKYGGGKMSLTQFNSLPHLEQVDLQHFVTYR